MPPVAHSTTALRSVTVGGVTERTIYDLTNGTAHRFRVAAINAAGRLTPLRLRRRPSRQPPER